MEMTKKITELRDEMDELALNIASWEERHDRRHDEYESLRPILERIAVALERVNGKFQQV